MYMFACVYDVYIGQSTLNSMFAGSHGWSNGRWWNVRRRSKGKAGRIIFVMIF